MQRVISWLLHAVVFMFAALGVLDLVTGHWRGVIMCLVVVAMPVITGAVGNGLLPEGVRLDASNPRAAGVRAIAAGYVAVAGAVLLLGLGARWAAGAMLLLGVFFIGLGLQVRDHGREPPG